MAALDKVISYQKQGLSDSQIIHKMRDEGISPKDINDALSQAKIKAAIQEQPENYPSVVAPEMEASIMPPEASQEAYQYPQAQAQPPAQEYVQYSEAPGYNAEAPAAEAPGFYAETPQAYGEQAYYPEQAAASSDTISEIAEQIVSEKFNEYREKTGDVVAFKNEAMDKIGDLDERLKRIERSIDKMQQAIIGKIGEFGEATENINRDLNALHGTVSKLMNPLIDTYNELKKSSPEPKKKSRAKIDELVEQES